MGDDIFVWFHTMARNRLPLGLPALPNWPSEVAAFEAVQALCGQACRLSFCARRPDFPSVLGPHVSPIPSVLGSHIERRHPMLGSVGPLVSLVVGRWKRHRPCLTSTYCGMIPCCCGFYSATPWRLAVASP